MDAQPSSSSSDARDKPRKASSGYDDSREVEEDVGPSAGSSVPLGSQGRSEPGPVKAPEAQNVETKSSELIESSRAPPPAVTVTWKQIELPTVQRDDQLRVAPNGVMNSENAIMPLRMGGLPEQPVRNSPTDQSVRGNMNVQGPMSMYEIHNYHDFPMPHSPVELQMMDYSQVPNLNSQTQMANGFAARAQWLHLQQQLAMNDPSMLSRLQDFQGQGYIPCDGILTGVQLPSNVSQQGLGDYNILSPASATFDPMLVPATFTGELGVLVPNLEANRLAEGGEPFGHSQLAAMPVSPVQVTQGRNRIPVPNSIYDPMYEALGLPVDPHLRFFLARQRDSGQFLL